MRMSRRLASGVIPCFKYTYTGSSTFTGDPKGDWVLTIKSSGTLNIQSLPKGRTIDIFLVGGGGGGAAYDRQKVGEDYYSLGTAGGGGGYTKTQKNVAPSAKTNYTITVGEGGARGTGQGGAGGTGKTTSAFGYNAPGGAGGKQWVGGAGGSGGGSSSWSGGLNGGSNGGNGGGGSENPGGAGQGTTKGTRAFGESSGALYSGGGGGGCALSLDGRYTLGSAGSGGSGGGGAGGVSASANTGGGGGGHSWTVTGNVATESIGAGGSGIVIIRNHR